MIIYKFKANGFSEKDIIDSLNACNFYLSDNSIHVNYGFTEISGDYVGQFISDKPFDIKNIKVINEIFEDNGAWIDIATFENIDKHTIP